MSEWSSEPQPGGRVRKVAAALPVVDRRVSHLGPGVEEIQSLDEVVHPGSQGLARLVGVFL